MSSTKTPTRFKWVHDLEAGTLTRIEDGVPVASWTVGLDGQRRYVPLPASVKPGTRPLVACGTNVHDGHDEAMAVAREVASLPDHRR